MEKVTEAVFLAGGFGTRLQSVVKDVPKPMADINGKPFLHYLITFYAHQGIEHVVLSTGYLHEVVSEYFGNNYRGVQISYAVENDPLGTGGAIKKSLELTNTNRVFVANGDTMFMVDLNSIAKFHKEHDAGFTLVAREVEDVGRYGKVILADDNRIVGFEEKNNASGKGFINGGVYLINKSFLNSFDFPEKFSIEKDFFENHYKEGAFYGKPCFNYFIDIGIPEEYKRAQTDFARLF